MDILENLKPREERPVRLVRASIVTRHDVIRNGSVLIVNGQIESIENGPLRDAVEIDLNGNFLMPGLLDLHSDAIEHEVEPRPNTFLPIELAIRQADRLYAGVGITTAFHSLSFWGDGDGSRNNQYNSDLSRAVVRQNPHAIIDNRIHARFEVTNQSGLAHVQSLIEDGTATLVSIMDHTPGQGQYPTEEAFRTYCRSTGMTDDHIDLVVAKKKDAVLHAAQSVRALSATVKKAGLPFASHDDDNPARFPEYKELGISLSEFPLNWEAARQAHLHGFAVLVGSPNVLRGISTGSGLRAIELIEAGLANVLCSDYVPATILPAIFKVHRQLGWSLPDAMALGTFNPAEAVNLNDRGQIAVGKRADLIEVEMQNEWPVVRQLWSGGRLAYSCQRQLGQAAVFTA